MPDNLPTPSSQSPASPEDLLALEREKIILEQDRLQLERERLENERIRHKQTLELSNRAAGRIVLPASTFALSLLLSLLVGGGLGAWLFANHSRSNHDAIAASVARAINPDGTNTLGSATIRMQGRNNRSAGYLLILD